VVARDYSESIRWYEKARERGEQMPSPKSPYPTFNTISTIK
jgi:TPR repeat protein